MPFDYVAMPGALVASDRRRRDGRTFEKGCLVWRSGVEGAF